MYSSKSYEGALEAAHQQNNLLNSIRNGTLAFRNGGMLSAMDKVQAHDEDTLGSGSGSGLSDLSALENETDDFGRLLLQHQRDARRLNNATRGTQQAFRRARPHARIAERLNCEERQRDRAAVEAWDQASSDSGNAAEPPVNVPREWGRHARKQSDWLRKITAPSGNGADDTLERLQPADDDSTGEAGPRLHSLETTPPSMQRGRYTATPSSLNHMNTTFIPYVTAEDSDADFTSESLITSTPVRSKHSRRIDDLAQVEIDHLNKTGTTRVIGQTGQRPSYSSLGGTASSRLRGRPVTDDLLSPAMNPRSPTTESRSPSRIPIRRQDGVGNKENLPQRGGVKGGSHSPDPSTHVNRTARPLTSKQLPQPVHRRNDSMSLLRKLARVPSMSPSPARDYEGTAKIQDVSPIKPTSDPSQEHAPDKAAFDVEETSLPQDPPTDPQTPVVAGAWIDTTFNLDPQPVIPTAEPVHKADQEEEAGENVVSVKIESTNPKSALEAIVREAKEHPSAQHYGESTLQSLENIVHPNMDRTDPSTDLVTREPMDAQDEEPIDDGRPLTQTEKDRRQETLAIEAMNKHLRTARTSIKDANRGLRRVENKIETVGGPAKAIITTPTSTIHPNPGHTHCQVCGGCYQSVWKALWIELRSCFYTWDTNSKYQIRFTWLGLACLLWWIWYLSESTLCSYYCHPFYAYRMEGYGVDPDAPRFPFVIPTLVFRPLRWLWKPVCDVMIEGLSVAFHDMFGDRSTSPPHPGLAVHFDARGNLKKAFSHSPVMRSQWMASATATGWRVAQSVVDAVDEVGSMLDDEVL